MSGVLFLQSIIWNFSLLVPLVVIYINISIRAVWSWFDWLRTDGARSRSKPSPLYSAYYILTALCRWSPQNGSSNVAWQWTLIMVYTLGSTRLILYLQGNHFFAFVVVICVSRRHTKTHSWQRVRRVHSWAETFTTNRAIILRSHFYNQAQKHHVHIETHVVSGNVLVALGTKNPMLRGIHHQYICVYVWAKRAQINQKSSLFLKIQPNKFFVCHRNIVYTKIQIRSIQHHKQSHIRR